MFNNKDGNNKLLSLGSMLHLYLSKNAFKFLQMSWFLDSNYIQGFPLQVKIGWNNPDDYED